MNINARKPLHNYSNTRKSPDNDNSQEIQEDSNITEGIPSNESDFDEEDSSQYPLHSEYKKRDVFESSRSVPPASPRSRSRAASSSPPIVKSVSKSKPVPKVSSKSYSLITIIAILLSAIIVGSLNKYSSFNDNEYNENECNYDELQEQYPHQDQELWRTLNVGINLIFNKIIQSPAVYLFVHQGGPRVFKLVHDIARKSSKCFGKSKSRFVL